MAFSVFTVKRHEPQYLPHMGTYLLADAVLVVGASTRRYRTDEHLRTLPSTWPWRMAALIYCESCHAAIIWTITPAGKPMPVDEYPTEKGNVLVLKPTALDEPLAVVLSGAALEAARRKTPYLRASHFYTCPNAAEHRRSK